MTAQQVATEQDPPPALSKESTNALVLYALAAAVPVNCTCGEPLHREFHTFGLWVHPDGLHTRPERVSLFRSVLHDATPVSPEPAMTGSVAD
jgi:hypothetical protein